MAEPESPEPSESAPRTQWHPMLVALLERYLPAGFKLYPEYLLSRLPQRADINRLLFTFSRNYLAHLEGEAQPDPEEVSVYIWPYQQVEQLQRARGIMATKDSGERCHAQPTEVDRCDLLPAAHHRDAGRSEQDEPRRADWIDVAAQTDPRSGA